MTEALSSHEHRVNGQGDLSQPDLLGFWFTQPVAQAEKSTISPAEVWAANGRKQGVPPQRQPAAETHTPATHLSTNVITECLMASLPQTETRDSHIKSTSVGSQWLRMVGVLPGFDFQHLHVS